MLDSSPWCLYSDVSETVILACNNRVLCKRIEQVPSFSLVLVTLFLYFHGIFFFFQPLLYGINRKLSIVMKAMFLPVCAIRTSHVSIVYQWIYDVPLLWSFDVWILLSSVDEERKYLNNNSSTQRHFPVPFCQGWTI